MKLLVTALAGLAGLATLAIAVPPPPPPGVALHWVNPEDGSFYYSCDEGINNVISRSDMSVAPDDNYQIVQECGTQHCVQNPWSAECQVVLPPSPIGDEAHVDIKARQEDKHYECSKDRSAVLICKYGFCSLDHYCKLKMASSTCHDDCNCCKMSDPELRSVGESDFSKNVKDKVVRIENTHASATGLEKRQENTPSAFAGCAPGIYSCAYNGVTHTAWVISCDGLGTWQWSSDCGANMKCIEAPSGISHCFPLKAGQTGKRDSLESSPYAQQASNSSDPYDCSKPGEYACSGGEASGIFVCNGSYKWIVSAECGDGNKCTIGPDGQAHCIPRKMKKNSSPDARDTLQIPRAVETATVSHIPSDSHCEVISSRTCSTNVAYVHYIFVCDDSHHWSFSEDCGISTTCSLGPDGLAQCVPITAKGIFGGAGLKEATTLATVAKKSAATAKA
ncbi:hypothetical protein EJ02DRAFT_482599 [Clathrospora elynae]|uniref:Uncharacterized protein n=1 Tax=Clathrospora elynae TaxID=706981 RepID=A0A6A5SWS5_9PLEO|nr:hypothetical protein EJ02DRAFT_482599 [Clathrospora elynae]